jgi:hypothetical protein
MRGHVTTESRESKEICRVHVWRLQAAVATTNNGSTAAANSWGSVRRDSMYNGVGTGLRDLVDKCHYRAWLLAYPWTWIAPYVRPGEAFDRSRCNPLSWDARAAKRWQAGGGER